MSSSFGTKVTFQGQDHLQPADAREEISERSGTAVLAEDPAREPAPPRGRRGRHRGGHRGAREVGREGRAVARDRVHAGARAAAGLHGRARGRRPRGDARRDRSASAATRRRSTRSSPSSSSSITRCRSTTSARRTRCGSTAARVPAQQGALPVPPLGAEGVRQLPRRAAGHGHRAPGEPRVPRARRVRERRDGRGCTRTRSSAPTRTRRWSTASASSAGASAASRPRRRCSASPCRCSFRRSSASSSRASCARRRDGDRSRAHRHADAPQEGRRRKVRRVLRRGPRHAHARRPRDDREHGAGVRRDVRHLPGRRRDARVPRASRAAATSRSRSSRRTRRSRASSSTRRSRPAFTDTLDLDLGDVRAEPRGPEAPAGSRAARRGEGELRRRARRDAASGPSRRPRRRTRRKTDGTVTSSITAPSSSRRSRAARTRRTRACSSPPAWSRRRPSSAGLKVEAVGEDEPRARLEGRHRVPREGGPRSVPREARLQPRRLRLHDVHRQQRAAARAGLEGHRGGQPRRRERALAATATSKGASTPRCARTTSRRRRSSSRTRSRARWTSTSTRSRSARARDGKPVFLQDLWPTPTEIETTIATSSSTRDVREARTPTSSTATTQWQKLDVPEGDRFAWDRARARTCAPAVLRGHDARRRRR